MPLRRSARATLTVIMDRGFDDVERGCEVRVTNFEGVGFRFEGSVRGFDGGERGFDGCDRRLEGGDRRFQVGDPRFYAVDLGCRSQALG